MFTTDYACNRMVEITDVNEDESMAISVLNRDSQVKATSLRRNWAATQVSERVCQIKTEILLSRFLLQNFHFSQNSHPAVTKRVTGVQFNTPATLPKASNLETLDFSSPKDAFQHEWKFHRLCLRSTPNNSVNQRTSTGRVTDCSMAMPDRFEVGP